jgi:spore coat polysaccharide biosynthesis predicted glycosyltransferase SpsG
MRVALRADAGPDEGVGHVMRLLSLSGGFEADEVVLLCGPTGVPWLEELLDDSGLERVAVPAAELSADALRACAADAVVVDSYRIPAGQISAVQESGRPVTLVCDSDTRGARAALYVDHNLGAEDVVWPPETAGRLLAGAQYSLVRQSMLDARRQHALSATADVLRILVFAGGSDVRSATTTMAGIVAATQVPVTAVVVAERDQHAAIAGLPWLGAVELHEPTPELPTLIAGADACLTAAGTSAWDVLTVGLPSAFVAVVANQEPSLISIDNAHVGLALGNLDRVRTDAVAATAAVRTLLTDRSQRAAWAQRAAEVFDGRGRDRVADAVRATTRA